MHENKGSEENTKKEETVSTCKKFINLVRAKENMNFNSRRNLLSSMEGQFFISKKYDSERN